MNDVQIEVSSEVMEVLQCLQSDGSLEINGLDSNRGPGSLTAHQNGFAEDPNVTHCLVLATQDEVMESETVVGDYGGVDYVNGEDDANSYGGCISGSAGELEYETVNGMELEEFMSGMEDGEGKDPGDTTGCSAQQLRYSPSDLTDDVAGVSVFRCYRCPQQFPKLQTLKGHVKRCHREEFDASRLRTEIIDRASVCRLCQYVATTTSAIRSHMMRKHKLLLERQHRELKTDPRRLNWGRKRLELQKAFPKVACLICGTETTLLKNYLAHIKRLHRDDVLFNSALKHIEEIRFLRRSKSSSVSLSCPLCKQSQDGAKILQHMRWVHFDDPNIKSLIRSTRELLAEEKKKVQAVEMQEVMECPHCRRRLKKVSLQNHLKFYCSSVAESPATTETVVTVTDTSDEAVKGKVNVPGGIATGRQLVTCEFCAKKIAFVKYGRHRRMVHKVSINKPVDSLMCSYCSKTFTEPHQLKTHLKKHTKEQLTICLLCYKWFYDEYVYQEHVRKVHWSALQFNCDQCGRGFWKEKTCGVHVCNPSDFEANRERRDTQTKKMELLTKLDRPLFVKVNPYEVNELLQETSIVLCLLCKKSFTCKASFDLHHETIHLAQYRHTCPHCGRNFIHRSQVRRHKCRPDRHATNVQKQMAEKQAALAERDRYVGPSSVTIERRDDIAEIMGDDLAEPEDDVYSEGEQTVEEILQERSMKSLKKGVQRSEKEKSAATDKSCAFVSKDVYDKIKLQLQTASDTTGDRKCCDMQNSCMNVVDPCFAGGSKSVPLDCTSAKREGTISVVMSNCIDKIPAAFVRDKRLSKLIDNQKGDTSPTNRTEKRGKLLISQKN